MAYFSSPQIICRAVIVLILVSSSTPRLDAQGTDDLTAVRAQVLQFRQQGRYSEAIPLAERYVELTRQNYGEQHAEHANALAWLGGLYRTQGRIVESEPLIVRALAIRERVLGAEHTDVGNLAGGLAGTYLNLGRHQEAETTYKRSIAILEKALGPENLEVTTSQSGLAAVYMDQGRYAEAEALYKHVIAVREKIVGPDRAYVANVLGGLAVLLDNQERFVEAEPLHRRALAIREKQWGPNHADVALSLSVLGSNLRSQGRHSDAEPLYVRSVRIQEATLKPNDPRLAGTLHGQALLRAQQGRTADAEAIYRRVLAMREASVGPEHPDVAITLNNIAGLYSNQGRFAEAKSLHERALSIHEKALGGDHPRVGLSLANLGYLHLAQGQLREVEKFWRRSTDLTVRRAQRVGTLDRHMLSGVDQGELARSRETIRGLVKVSYQLAENAAGQRTDIAQDMLRTAQWSLSSEAAASLLQMAARSARNDVALASLVRARQDLAHEWQARDSYRISALSRASGQRDGSGEAANTKRLMAIDQRVEEIDKLIRDKSPGFAELARPEPSSIEEIQRDLSSDEAMIVFLDTSAMRPLPEETFVWVITKTDTRWSRSPLGTGALAREVAILRCGLDAEAWLPLSDGQGDKSALPALSETMRRRTVDCQAALQAAPTTDAEGRAVLPFDLTRAHALYKALLGPVEDLIESKRLLLVPSGSLTRLPFQVLVTEPPTGRSHRQVAWLARKHALTVLPAVSSLKALRRIGKPSTATKPMIGFGNPLLDGNQTHKVDGGYFKQQAALARAHKGCAATDTQQTAALRGLRRSVTPLPQLSGLADLAHVLRQSPLPETADELCAVARALKIDATDIRLGARATEREVKQLSVDGELAKFRVLHFATHGTLAGQLSGTTEPGLILTPPVQATEEDDGYLSSSEIADLKLDADWVILSACNTAGGAGTESASGAEALSGLARAFFYAGARALLVSHWAVNSDATVKLITAAVGAISKDTSVGRAEALRRAMLAMIDKGAAHEAHPAYWAPFIVVGEGGR